MKIYKITNIKKISKKEEDFNNLADLQRAQPESAMLKLTNFHQGVLSLVAEHAGDIIHRMNEKPIFHNAGYEYVKEKVAKVLRQLQDPYGFYKEHLENMEDNANYSKINPNTYKNKVKELLLNYANTHKQLPTFNDAQKTAQNICVAIGEERFNDAINGLIKLQNYLQSPEKWKQYAHEGLQ